MSRLERLLSLLETGSTAITRRAAALQLGEVQRLHPHELHNLLASVYKYIRHPVWETRIAAGLAVQAILNKVPAWCPSAPTSYDDGEDSDLMIEVDEVNKLSFSTFDFEDISSKSAHLMGSEGSEYDPDKLDKSDKSSLEKQKQRLDASLGLNLCAKLVVDTSELFSKEDLKVEVNPSQSNDNKVNVSEVVGPSMREINRARRKAKLALMRQRSCQDNDENGRGDSGAKRIKLEKQNSEQLSIIPPENQPTPDNTGYWPSEAVTWPLEWFCERLLTDLFSLSWEVRHGAATSLRHLIQTRGSDGGRASNMSFTQMSSAHQGWLEDIALRLVCVLTLDRFGDFVSDQVVAPVRETCAQALGSLTVHISDQCVEQLVTVLLKLVGHQDWETRHGGLLGIKYTLAARQDMVQRLVPLCLDKLHSALSDSVDDVSAVAGAALSLTVDPLSRLYPDKAMGVFHSLVSLIPELDDLTPASNTLVPLVVQLLTHPNLKDKLRLSDEVENLVRRIWSLMEHNNSSVRKAALETLSALPCHRNVELLRDTLTHIFQRALFEHFSTIQPVIKQVWCGVISKNDVGDVLLAACPLVTHWLCLAMQPSRFCYEPNLILRPQRLHNKTVTDGKFEITELKMYIGGVETVPPDQRDANSLGARYLACEMLGYLSRLIVEPAPGVVYNDESETPIALYVNVLLVYLNSKSCLQRLIAGLVIGEWAKHSPPSPAPPLLVTKLNECLNQTIYYDEMALAFTKLLQDTKDFLALMKHYQVPGADNFIPESILTFDQMENVCGKQMAQSIEHSKLKGKALKTVEDRRIILENAVNVCRKDYASMNITTLAALAGGLLHLRELPDKLGPLVKPLMDSVKLEGNSDLQRLGAENVSVLVKLCLDRNPSTVTKIITNLSTYLCCDTNFTPVVSSKPVTKGVKSKVKMKKEDDESVENNGILTLSKQQQSAERALLRSNSASGRRPGRPSLVSQKEPPPPDVADSEQNSREIQRRGATLALTYLVRDWGVSLPTELPLLWHCIIGHLISESPSISVKRFQVNCEEDPLEAANRLIGLLQVLEVTASAVNCSLFSKLVEGFERLLKLLCGKECAVRHMAARCIASLSAVKPEEVMLHVIRRVLPMLGAGDDADKRRGAVECVYVLMEKMHLTLVPYITFLIIPIMGRMSDQDESVRSLATLSFARLIQLMPLDGGKEDHKLCEELTLLKKKERTFLEQLFNPLSIQDYKVPLPISTQLRSYQQAGVNWLKFLNKYRLHGILCDDMGLGKTLQSICILAGDHYDRKMKFKETKDSDCSPLPSLVVCPPTLTGHWVFEVNKFINKKYLNPLHFVGTPVEREKLKIYVKFHNLVVASYDIVRKDIHFFSKIKWNYCILDEGHQIKNAKTKSTQAIKMLQANHRLILSGTPIQNNVLELWSLFDFLMPGFLGTEKQFTARYSRPILASRDPKSTQKERESGILAMESLHRQVLPFVLRRMKEDVLKELPPKITQDYYCELSPLQKQLYEDFSKSQAHQSLADRVDSHHPSAHTHVFQALRYMQSVCNHPKLALTTKHPQYETVKAQLAAQNSSLSDIEHAAKLPALKQLLNDCGIGVGGGVGTEDDAVVNQHRALIFCQLKTMLDIVEDLLRTHMPTVSYLRLDGTVTASSRNAVVTTFNNDPSIDLLLLTTQVGGLGLNLTGADTVIFVEHDWSPMRDLQAMDRAHRIGQRKVVNVYRLITKGTLEEKIMGLQKFKLMTANTVISPENASLETMSTDKLLDLFSKKSEEEESHRNTAGKTSSSSSRALADSLQSLLDHQDYDKEYDIENFMANLHPATT